MMDGMNYTEFSNFKQKTLEDIAETSKVYKLKCEFKIFLASIGSTLLCVTAKYIFALLSDTHLTYTLDKLR